MFLAETKEMEYISNFLWKENKFASLKYQVNAWFAMINKGKKKLCCFCDRWFGHDYNGHNVCDVG